MNSSLVARDSEKSAFSGQESMRDVGGRGVRIGEYLMEKTCFTPMFRRFMMINNISEMHDCPGYQIRWRAICCGSRDVEKRKENR